MSDGEVIKSVRQVRPQLEPQQVKALLGGSPKLLKAVQDGVQGSKLLEKVLHEVLEKKTRFQGLVPKLGLKKDTTDVKQQENPEGWSKVQLGKGGKKQQVHDVVKTPQLTMQLQRTQIACKGRPLQVREALLHGYGGVCVAQNKEELLRLAKLSENDSQVAALLSDAGFSVTPSKKLQYATKVAWSKAETLEEAKKLAKEVLKDAVAKQELEGSNTPWTKEAALFIKGSAGRGGQASFGLRLPPAVLSQCKKG
eukprot:628325-Amphidinium_carterae.2